MAIRLARDPVARSGGVEGALSNRPRRPNVEKEVPTLGRSHGGDRKAESKNRCRHHDAHEQIVTGDARLGQRSGITGACWTRGVSD
jgi:hypothetical protein